MSSWKKIESIVCQTQCENNYSLRVINKDNLPIPIFPFLVGVVIHEVPRHEDANKVQNTELKNNLEEFLETHSTDRDI